MKTTNILGGLSALAGVLVLSGCLSTDTSGTRDHADEQGDPRSLAIEAMLEELYAAFCFTPGGRLDWERLRSLFADGAVFVAPFAEGASPVASGAEAFIRDFKSFIESSPLKDTGFTERILHSRVEVAGTIGHAWVTFEGYRPGEKQALTRGIDSIQLVLDHGNWKLLSFTTQYESNH